MKLEPRSPAKPSRVVHIRNIPNEVSEAEIVHLGIPFGRVTNVLVLKGKNQVRAVSRPSFSVAPLFPRGDGARGDGPPSQVEDETTPRANGANGRRPSGPRTRQIVF